MGTIVLVVALTSLFLIILFPNRIIALINSTCMSIPMGYAGIRTLFGKFEKKRKAGFMWKIPFFHEVEMVTLDIPFRILVLVKCQTRGGDSLDVEVALDCVGDFELLDIYYYAIKNGKDQLNKLIEDAIQSLVGNIASIKELEDFYQKREALQLALNCYARLSMMPHMKPVLIGLPEGKKISSSKTLDFYSTHRLKISELISHETDKGNENDRSEIEIRYGINVRKVEVKAVVLSKETQTAINQKKTDEAQFSAAEFKKKLIKEFQEECKLSPEEALHAAEVSLRQTTGNSAYTALGLKGLVQVQMGGK